MRASSTPGHRGVERGRPEIEQARGTRADDQEPAIDLVLADLAVEHAPGREVALLFLVGEADPHLAVGFGRHLVIADTDLGDAGLLAEGGLAARAGGLHHIGRGALREPEHVSDERGIHFVADHHHHGHTADDLVMLRQPVERTGSRCVLLQLGQARGGAGIIGREQPRVIAAVGKACLGRRDRRALRCGNEAQHHGSLANRLGEDLVVGWELLHLFAQAL